MDKNQYNELLESLFKAEEEGTDCTEIIQEIIYAQLENQELVSIG